MSGQTAWHWINRHALLLLHDESLSLHGGAAGIRDEGLLDSALARPLHLDHYGEPDVADLAAAYCVGLAKNHPFVDGNKRTAFMAVGLFLHLNGQRLIATQAEATVTILAVAAGELDDFALASWLRSHIGSRMTKR